MSRGGRQKFGAELVDAKQVRHVWSALPMGSTIPVWVVILPTSVSVIARHSGERLARAYPTEQVGVYDMTIPLREFLADIRFVAKHLLKRFEKRAA